MADVKGFFEDVGLADADELAVKTQAVVVVVAGGIAERSLTQEAGQSIGQTDTQSATKSVSDGTL